MSIFSLGGLFGSALSGGDNMPTAEEINRMENEVRLQNGLADMEQGIDQKFRAMEKRIAELEQLYVPNEKAKK